jgi:hypothetical protein
MERQSKSSKYFYVYITAVKSLTVYRLESDPFCGKSFMKYKGWDKLYNLYGKYLTDQFRKLSQINYVV